jgi:hypothetical protein
MIDPTGQWPGPTCVMVTGLRLRTPEPVQHITTHGVAPWPLRLDPEQGGGSLVVLPVWVLALFIADLGKLAKT